MKPQRLKGKYYDKIHFHLTKLIKLRFLEVSVTSWMLLSYLSKTTSIIFHG